MLNEDSDASEPEEEAQENIATLPTSVDEPPVQSVTNGDSSSDDDDDSSSDVIQPQLHTSTNGVTWDPLHIARVKPATAANVFRVKPGVHPAIRRRASISPYECWKLFIDNNMLRAIQTHTNREARKIDPNFSLTMKQLEAFIALQYTRGIYGKHHSVHFLWKKTYGPSIFRDTMAIDCFLEIKKFIRFDNKDRRRQRLIEDKFVHIREQLESFVTNCLFNYTPDWSLTIDEQLFPMKNRCPFIVYMPNKPDKFGMKFWILTEVDSKYVYNILPYVGALEREQRDGRPLA